MRRKVASIATAAALITGGGALAVVNAAPVLAQEVAVESMNPFQSFIQSLLDDGVITQEQADVIAERAQEVRAEFGHRGHRGARLEVAADAIGITSEQLRDAVQAGSTIAEVAGDNGVDPQSVIDALVAEKQERLDQAVADGRLTEEEAAEKAAEIETNVNDAVNGEIDLSERGPRRGRGGPDRPFGDPGSGEPDTGA
ncbi:MAG: hypothetical protein HKO10_01595 [Acidimicrobiia bacterium]|nr:hypothetical protein [Acidimicrobiia bacterium]